MATKRRRRKMDPKMDPKKKGAMTMSKDEITPRPGELMPLDENASPAAMVRAMGTAIAGILEEQREQTQQLRILVENQQATMQQLMSRLIAVEGRRNQIVEREHAVREHQRALPTIRPNVTTPDDVVTRMAEFFRSGGTERFTS